MSDRTGLVSFRRPLDRRTGIRWTTRLHVSIRENRYCRHDVALTDIGLAGCRVKTGFRLRPGMHTDIRVPGFEPFKAIVIWSNGKDAGLRFLRPLNPAIVAHLVKLADEDAMRNDPDTPERRAGYIA